GVQTCALPICQDGGHDQYAEQGAYQAARGEQADAEEMQGRQRHKAAGGETPGAGLGEGTRAEQRRPERAIDRHQQECHNQQQQSLAVQCGAWQTHIPPHGGRDQSRAAAAHVVTIAFRCTCSGIKASAATAQQIAAAHRLWLRKCAPCAMRSRRNAVPTSSVSASMRRRCLGLPVSRARKYSATRLKPLAAWPPGKQWPTSAAATNQPLLNSAPPPNSTRSQGQW